MKRNVVISIGIMIPVFAFSLMGAAFPDPPAEQLMPGARKAIAVLAGGCFWGMQGVFEHVKGVTDTTVGYSGGEKKTAEYEKVSTGKTGHAESIQITYDPAVITYGQLLKIYFSIAHDPTTLNRQHNDEGTQYRSEIFYGDENQKAIAEKYVAQLNAAKVFHSPIVTKIEALKGFYAAEQHHQHYLDTHGDEEYIKFFDLPMIAQLKKVYPDMYKK